MRNPSEAATTVMFVDVDELIQKAWGSVERSGIPEALQVDAFKEAVAYLRSAEDADARTNGDGKSSGRSSSSSGRGRKKRAAAPKGEPDGASEVPDEDEFFASLATESGVDEARLRDLLQLTNAGLVHVNPPTKDVGTSVKEQAQRIVALVSSARSRGLGENPVSAESVHAELKRKHCWNHGNFSSKHLGPMRGFNAGSNRTEIVLTSKWLEEFKFAVDSVLGDVDGESDD